MCHEEIHRRSRADLADRDPVAHRDCKRSPRVAVELLIRKQRLLTISGGKQALLFAAYDLAFERDGRLALASRPPSCCQINIADEGLLLAAAPAHGPHQWRGWIVRMNARAIKA